MRLIHDYSPAWVITIEQYHLNYGQLLMKQSISKKVKYSGEQHHRSPTVRSSCFSLRSYRPDGTSDPFSESGIVWSFNFFFHNRKLRRVLFLTCRADSLSSQN